MVDKNDYNNFRQALLEEKTWPLKYMFKFIVPNTDGKVDLVKGMLPQNGVFSYKHTANLKYVSVTCTATMSNPDAIINVTQQATSVGGVIAL